jgi:hypothetical protein
MMSGRGIECRYFCIMQVSGPLTWIFLDTAFLSRVTQQILRYLCGKCLSQILGIGHRSQRGRVYVLYCIGYILENEKNNLIQIISKCLH